MYYVYILLCADKSLYTGITTDLERRLKDHREGNGSKYVRSRLPAKVVYSKEFENKSEALKREIEIKKMSRVEKIQLVKATKVKSL